MKEIKFEKKNSEGEILRARFVCPDEIPNKLPVVIMLTGDGPKGSKSMSWVNMPPRLLKHGISSLLFDFSGLGNSDGERKNLTLTKGISDFKTIFEELKHFSWIDRSNLGIMASSFGACAALMCPDIMNQCKVLGFKSPCCFLPDAYLNEISMQNFNEWIKSGFCKENGYDISVFFDSFQYNVYNQAKQIHSTCLITHGNNDEIVPFTQSLYLKEFLIGQTELKVFENGDHGYSGENWEKMANLFELFYQQHLI